MSIHIVRFVYVHPVDVQIHNQYEQKHVRFQAMIQVSFEDYFQYHVLVELTYYPVNQYRLIIGLE